MQTAIVMATQEVGQVTQTILPLATQASQLQHVSTTFATATSTDIEGMGQATSSHAETTCSQMIMVAETVSAFVVSELQQDVPTGTTPARQAYRFPRGVELAATEPRDVLLQKFELARQQSLMAPVEETGEETGEDVEETGDSEGIVEEEAGITKGESVSTTVPLKENLSTGIPRSKTRGSVRRGEALNNIN
jgi:hypothetical protein